MNEPIRISPEEVRSKVKSGSALLVCAYDDDSRFAGLHLEGAISFNEFKKIKPGLGKDQEIIFYCA
jgi:hypothetical protein